MYFDDLSMDPEDWEDFRRFAHKMLDDMIYQRRASENP